MGKTSLNALIDETVNCGVNPQGDTVVVVYSMPHGAKDPNFGWNRVGGGRQACFRARTSDGDICGHDSNTIPEHVFSKLGSANQGKSGNSYKVTMKSGGQDLSQYF